MVGPPPSPFFLAATELELIILQQTCLEVKRRNIETCVACASLASSDAENASPEELHQAMQRQAEAQRRLVVAMYEDYL